MEFGQKFSKIGIQLINMKIFDQQVLELDKNQYIVHDGVGKCSMLRILTYSRPQLGMVFRDGTFHRP